MPTRKEIKSQARLDMKQSNPSIYVVALVYILLTYALAILNTAVNYAGVNLQQLYSATSYEELMTVMASVASESRPFGTLISLLLEVFSQIIGCGFILGCLNVSRGISSHVSVLFDGFSMFFKLLLLLILEAIFIGLWSMLLIVPGIVASYRYSMAVYIMLDHPDMSAMDCIRQSKEMMAGRKWTLFVQHLSFILWDLLCIIPFVSVFVMPYIETSNAVFYNYCSGQWEQQKRIEET